jgi:hypothetical protein
MFERFGKEHWLDEQFNVSLARGHYWLRMSPSSNAYWGAVYNSRNYPAGFSRSASGVEFSNPFPTVLRVAGAAVPEPSTISVVGAFCGLLCALGRRCRRP